MVVQLSGPSLPEIRLLPQERPGDCRFSGQFVATSNALRQFGEATILAALRTLHHKVCEGQSLDYLQVFEVGSQKLWIIDDGDVVTALRPEDY